MYERLIYTLAAAGVPVDRITLTGPTSAALAYAPGATQTQRDAGAAVLAAFDWGAAAQAAWEADRARAAALAAVDSPEALARAARAGCVALLLSLQEARAKVNELVGWANAQGATIAPLETGDTLPEATSAVRALIEAGVV